MSEYEILGNVRLYPALNSYMLYIRLVIKVHTLSVDSNAIFYSEMY